MKTNQLPKYDMSDNPTGCCPRFNSNGWNLQALHFEDKLFLRATTKSVANVPKDMDSVFEKTFKAIEGAGAFSDKNVVVLSRDLSPEAAEHLFSVNREVPGQEMMHLSGDYQTFVFDGPYDKAPDWQEDVVQKLADQGKETDLVYYFLHDLP